MSNFFTLSTDQLAERDRIEIAHDVIGRSLMKMEFELQPDVPFKIDMALRTLPDFALVSGTLSPMNCVRTAELIDSNDLVLSVALSGGSTLHVRGKELPIGRGMAALTRTSDVSHCVNHSTSESLNFRFPFDKIAPLVADLDDAVMRSIPVNTEAIRLLVHYASMLNQEDLFAAVEVQSVVSTHLQDLVALAIGATRDAAEVANGRGIPAARLRAIKADIVKNIADRNLTIDAVALRHGITPRYVSMLFDGDATTFSEFVLMQRLNRAHRMLIDPRFSGWTISSVAFEAGFGDLSYFNRVFRRAYGGRPSDVRAQAQSAR